MTTDNVQPLKPGIGLIEERGRKVLTIPIARIESCCPCEDGMSWMAIVTLVDGRTVAVTLCPGSPIIACAVETSQMA